MAPADEPAAADAVVLIVAAGRGVRMGGDVTRPKTTLPVMGESILQNLLRAISEIRGRRRILVVTSKEDASRAVERHLSEHGLGDVVNEVVPVDATSYLEAVAAVVNEIPTPIPALTVVDADLWTSPANLRRVFSAFSSPPPGAIAGFAVSALPRSEDPRCIRVAISSDRSLCRASGSDHPRTIGAYWWAPAGQSMIRSFTASGGSSFHRFVDLLVDNRVPSFVVDVDESHNINTPEELRAAARYRLRLGPAWS